MPASPPFYSVLQFFSSFLPGFRLIDGSDLKQMSSLLYQTTTGIKALAAGGQAGATPLNYGLNRVDTVANVADSVMLPPAIPRLQIRVYNNTGNSVQVFGSPSNPNNGNVGDTIAANNSNTQEPTATGVAQASTVPAIYSCYVLGQWKQSISA